MRTIKFRGLRIDGKGEAFGFIVPLFDRCWIIETKKEKQAKGLAETLGGIYTSVVPNLMVEVNPETIQPAIETAKKVNGEWVWGYTSLNNKQ